MMRVPSKVQRRSDRVLLGTYQAKYELVEHHHVTETEDKEEHEISESRVSDRNG